MTVSTTQGSPACRNTYPATGGSSKIAISGRMFSPCQTCAKRKGNYGMRRNWSTGHCKRGGKPFEVVYIDFVSMPPLKGQAVHTYYSRQLQPPPHGHTMCQRPRNRRSPRTLPVLSSSPRDSPHCLLRPRNPLHWWGLQGILWPNLDHPGTSLPVATHKARGTLRGNTGP